MYIVITLTLGPQLANKLQDLHLNGTSTVNTPAESDSETPLSDTNGVRDIHSRRTRGKQRKDGKPKELKFALHAGKTIEELEQMHLQKLEEAAARPLIANKDAVSLIIFHASMVSSAELSNSMCIRQQSDIRMYMPTTQLPKLPRHLAARYSYL